MPQLKIIILSQTKHIDSFHGLTITFKGEYNGKFFICEYVPNEGSVGADTLHDIELDILAHNFNYDHTIQTVSIRK